MRLYIFVFLIITSLLSWSQEETDSIKKEILTIGLGPQVNTFFGDISPNSGTKIFINSRPAFTFDFEKRFGKVLGIQLMAIKGELADHYYPKSFITKFTKTNLNIILNTDNYFDNKHNFSIYAGIGIGIIKYNAFGDLINTNPYAIDTNTFDYEYETMLNDGITLLAPLSIGFKWKITPYLQGRIYGTFNTLFSDEIDNQIEGKNDSYSSLGFTLNYAFHKITRVIKEKIYVDLENFDLTDEDNDGVIDLEDKCHHTPKKVKVDINGCPIDTDKDGVPDYIDIEPNSKYILHVDEQGRSLTDSLIYYRFHLNDSVDIELNKTFSIDTTGSDSLIMDSLNLELNKLKLDKITTPIIDTSSKNEMNLNFNHFKNNGLLKPSESNHEFNHELLTFQILARKEN